MSWHLALAAFAARRPEAPCLLGPDGGDWQTVWARIEQLAAHFAVHRGRVVAIALPDGPRAVEHLVGGLLSGAMVLPMPSGATAHERERLLAELDVALVVDAPLPEHLESAAWTPPGPDDVALLVTTSGSTAQPKRVALKYAGLAWNATAHADALALPQGVRTLVVSPLYHAFPLVAQVLATLLRGGAIGFLGGVFTPRGLVKYAQTHAIGYAALTPTALQLLRERCPVAPLPDVLSVGAAPITPADLLAGEAWARANGCPLYYTYGLSEAGPRVSTLGPDEMARRPASVGRPLPGVEVSIRHPETGDLATGEGELWLRSPSLMAGYYPQGDGLEADGWLRTGDLATLDAEGYLSITGRLKDVIVSGGTTVSLREIEEALLLDSRLSAAAVVGVTHAIYGEVPRACLVAKEPLTRQDVLTHLSGLLSRQKWPQEFMFLPELPRTALGKVDRAKLKELPCEASP